MQRLVDVLVIVTLIEMMFAVGLGVTLRELGDVATNGRLLGRALLANYVWVPALTLTLLLLFGAGPMIAAGFLILAVCPGAPFGPSCTTLARGNTVMAVGVMALLAASSALLAPLLLQGLLLLLSAIQAAENEDAPPTVDTLRIVRTLLVTQLLPLAVGLAVRRRWPAAAVRLYRPANAVGAILGLGALALIVVVQFDTLTSIHVSTLVGMLLLLAGTVAFAWLVGGPGADNRRAMALTTSLRNVGVGLVIANAAFPGTPAVTATTVYGVFEIVASLLLALAWSRYPMATPMATGTQVAVATPEPADQPAW